MDEEPEFVPAQFSKGIKPNPLRRREQLVEEDGEQPYIIVCYVTVKGFGKLTHAEKTRETIRKRLGNYFDPASVKVDMIGVLKGEEVEG